jgi:hypothetical protein
MPRSTSPILPYQAPSAPTAARHTASRWLKHAAIITAGLVVLTIALHLLLVSLAAPTTPIAWLAACFSNNHLLTFPALFLAAASAACAGSANSVLRANALACYAAAALVMALQLFTLILIAAAIARVIMALAGLLSPANLLFALPALPCLAALSLLNDLNTLLQFIARHPNGETTLKPFLPRVLRR